MREAQRQIQRASLDRGAKADAHEFELTVVALAHSRNHVREMRTRRTGDCLRCPRHPAPPTSRRGLLFLFDRDAGLERERQSCPSLPSRSPTASATVALTPAADRRVFLATRDMAVHLHQETTHRTSPPWPIARACASVITPLGVDTITVPMPPRTFGSWSLPR